jgi:hypothetical protein
MIIQSNNPVSLTIIKTSPNKINGLNPSYYAIFIVNLYRYYLDSPINIPLCIYKSNQNQESPNIINALQYGNLRLGSST